MALFTSRRSCTYFNYSLRLFSSALSMGLESPYLLEDMFNLRANFASFCVFANPFLFKNTMDTGSNLLISQSEDDFNASQSSFSPAPFFPYSRSPHASMLFVMPPHGFSAMRTSSGPASPIFFHPLPIHMSPWPSSPRSQSRARVLDSSSQMGALHQP